MLQDPCLGCQGSQWQVPLAALSVCGQQPCYMCYTYKKLSNQLRHPTRNFHIPILRSCSSPIKLSWKVPILTTQTKGILANHVSCSIPSPGGARNRAVRHSVLATHLHPVAVAPPRSPTLNVKKDAQQNSIITLLTFHSAADTTMPLLSATRHRSDSKSEVSNFTNVPPATSRSARRPPTGTLTTQTMTRVT